MSEILEKLGVITSVPVNKFSRLGESRLSWGIVITIVIFGIILFVGGI